MRQLITFILSALFVTSLGACAFGDTSGTGDDDGGDGNPPAPVCGDGLCAGPEIGKCPADCGNPPAGPVCGNSRCETGETTANCVSDCPAQSACGNNVCDAGENTANCPNDCPAQGNCPANPFSCVTCAGLGVLCPSGHNQTSCTDCIIAAGGGNCSGGFPNAMCDAGETTQSCPFDCM